MQLYVWQPRGLESVSAGARFNAVLDRLATSYAESYGEPFEVRTISADDSLVGVVGPATGVKDGEATQLAGPHGMVIAGVPEPDVASEGGAADSRDLTNCDTFHKLLAVARDRPDPWSGAAEWRGRWAAVAWQSGRAVVVNGSSPGLRLWWTDGPDGWALGSLPGALLAFTARPREIDLDIATLTAALGYLRSSRGLFAGVYRFMPGDRVLLQADFAPALMPFTGFDAALGPRQGLTYDEVIEAIAHRATGLVGAGVARSTSPRIGLSGGRDSRLLAAALVQAGYPIVASTGGPATSADVVIARQVASALGLEHIVAADAKAGDTYETRRARARAGGRARSLPMTAERLAAWVALHDGTAPAYFAWIARDLSVRREISARSRGQLVSGLGGEVHRGAYYPRARDIDRPGTAGRGRDYVLDLFASGSRLRRPVRELLAQEIRDQGDALGDEALPLSEWMSRFYWRFKEAFRHADVFAATDSVNWTFAPLMDLGFLALSREAPAATKMSNRLVEDVTVRLAPALAGIPYDRPPSRDPPELAVRALGRLGLIDAARTAGRRLSGQPRPAASTEVLRTMWETVYFGPGDHLWPALINERQLRRLVRDHPAVALLRDLAVPELLARTSV